MFNELLTWLGFGPSVSTRAAVEELCRYWEICRKEDIGPAIAGLQKRPDCFFYKPEIIEHFQHFFSLKYPYAPRPAVFSITRRGEFTDDLRGPVESLIREGYEPERITADGIEYLWWEDFVLEFCPSALPLPEHFRWKDLSLDIGSSETEPMGSETNYQPVVMSRKEFRELVRKHRGKESFRIRVRWLSRNSMPHVGAKMNLHLIHAGEEHGFHLNRSTDLISPLSRWLLTGKQIHQPADAWKTFFKFRIADRDIVFVHVPATQTEFRDALSKKNSDRRYTAGEISDEDKPGEYYIAYTPGLQRTLNQEELRTHWRLIQIERQFLEGGRTRALSEKTLQQEKILREVIADGSSAPYKDTAAIYLLREQEKKLKKEGGEGDVDDLDVSQELIEKTAEQIRRHKRQMVSDNKQPHESI